MRAIPLILSIAVLSATGCVSRKTSQLQAQAAFLAGEHQSAQAVPMVLVQGDVANRAVSWHEGMTLADALLAADYRGLWDPQTIVIHRQSQQIAVNVRKLLHGGDNPPVLPGDLLEVRR